MAKTFFQKRSEGRAEMSFVDHLEELRWHIIRSVLAILVLAVIIFIYHKWVFDNIIFGPINPNFVSYRAICNFSHWVGLGDGLCMPPINLSLQATTVTGQFFGTFTVAFIGGLIAAFPYIFWEFWRFVRPALKPKELKNTRFIIFWVSFFFFTGAAFGYFILGPFTFNFLGNFQMSSINLVVTKPTVDDYLNNLTNLILGCGIAFELPVLALVLTRIGLITPSFLKRSRKYAIVVILIAAAIITPSPDWYSQTIVFIPLYSLYELGVAVSIREEKRQAKREKEEWS